ncbi:hypothetical protein DPMN_047856 [Dreissena polymorpha]|uniref:Uncharacterized protein n=1 Tax=Dreissena polymorpha TaxID=45954 RepID=A0A9D4D9I7_DREPO|nr:hypothetical protein DPMN_047856 [Dreissena polymorpha]
MAFHPEEKETSLQIGTTFDNHHQSERIGQWATPHRLADMAELSEVSRLNHHGKQIS